MPAEKRRRAEAPAIVPERGDPGIHALTTPEDSTTAALPIFSTPSSSNTSADPGSQPSSFTFPLNPDVNIDVPMMATF
ncbi:hypothetical protein COCC4DRAFT_37651 [Bipolaris maydis ATCC 48331]|uniref:Uncharacterized protein n=2 Tax=Cochliobolus heterostrophus TaxID=5016 RepID=M2UEQ1_COCH5|nr:uncharacterized protein COCC4DRAFT_37651 [Bipolaris maydis ATCC 48331]EMD92176.1 hypothetical protein COCHEDRAFT_1213256 [Bipolaris maydis C5]ENI07867.1 hypothetical protein COCC4DRAFT_37651 [Bipolaris maydis ATCC 48331]KAJ5022035.1 hypothetical protein J3E73DRAFT_374295 [Bipolaris maydis]KAJ6281443.1 hypothetical protein J3E71DRAFT_342154 [Bipolaris maydis]